MTQTMAESLNPEEYSHLLAFGDPFYSDGKKIPSDSAHVLYTDNDSQLQCHLISTLESTTYPDMTFGYIEAH